MKNSLMFLLTGLSFLSLRWEFGGIPVLPSGILPATVCVDSAGRNIKIIDIAVSFSGKEKNIPQLITEVFELPECPSVFMKDSIVHIYRKDFDTAYKAIVFIHYDGPGASKYEGKHTFTAFMKEKDTVKVSLAMNKKKLFYRISERKGTRILASGNKKHATEENVLHANYVIKKKDNPLVTYKVTETHTITIIERMPYKIEDDFGCE